MPRPSSAISIVTSSPAAEALSVIVPFRPLARANALVRRFDAVAHGVANQMQNRIHHPLDQVLVDFRRLALQEERDLPAGLAREIAHDEGHAPEDLADGTRRTRMSPSRSVRSWRSIASRVFLDVAPFGRRARSGSMRDSESSRRARLITRSPTCRISSSSRREVDADDVRRRGGPAAAGFAVAARRRDRLLRPLSGRATASTDHRIVREDGSEIAARHRPRP